MPTHTAPPRPGTSGLVADEVWEQFDFGPYSQFPTRKQKVHEFYLMAHYDATVRAALLIIRFMLLSKLGGYAHPNPSVQQRVTELLGRIEGGVAGIFRKLSSALWAGYAVAEKEWQFTEGEWATRRLELLHPLTFFSATGDDEGISLDPVEKRVTQLRQYKHERMQRVDDSITLGVEQVVYWPMLAEAREDVYGNSLLDGARRAWFSKVKQERFWNTFAQKCAMPTPVFWVPQTTVTDGRTGRQVSLSEYLPGVYEKLQPGQGVAIPIDSDMPYKLETLVPTGDGEAFERICRYWDSQLFKAILTPRLLLEEPEHSSRAQASTNLDLFLLTLEGIRSEMAEVVIEQLVRPLIDYNLGEQSDYGHWEFDRLQEQDLERLARVFEAVERGKAAARTSGAPLSSSDDTRLRSVFEEVYGST